MFFEQLGKNNHKEWFHANKKHYEQEVKAPFLALLDHLIPELTTWDPRIPQEAKTALFRINKDIRFSKDKSPYHTVMKAGFSPNGKKSMLPGYYLGIDAHNIHVGGGLFMLRPPELKKLREHIARDTDQLVRLVENADFISSFGRIKGEKAKRLDKSLVEAAEKTDLIYNKQFYAMAEFPLEPFFGSEELTEEILEHFKGIRPLIDYLTAALE